MAGMKTDIPMPSETDPSTRRADLIRALLFGTLPVAAFLAAYAMRDPVHLDTAQVVLTGAVIAVGPTACYLILRRLRRTARPENAQDTTGEYR